MLSPSSTRLPRSLLVGSLALAGLLAVLAALQYRWLGQVSEADEARLRAGVRSRAEQLARDFDREVTHAFLWLQVHSSTLRERDWSGYAERHARWARTAAYPALVQDVYVTENDRLLRFDPAAATFEPVEWPAPLAGLRERLREASAPPAPPPSTSSPMSAATSPPPRHRWPLDWIDDEVPALLAPIPSFGPESAPGREPTGGFHLAGFTIIRLDLDCVRGQLLPALARRHFGPAEESDYSVEVNRRGSLTAAIFRSHPEAGLPQRGGDVTTGLLDLRPEDLPEEDLAAASPPGSRGLRGEPRRFGWGRRGASTAARGEGGRWQLVVTHRAGTLDQIVAAARHRNLAVSGGILALLAASIVLVLVSAQRARRLADRQLEFVAAVSHELRTPVAVICSAGENLADGIVSDRDTVRQYGRVVRDQGRSLAEMVELVLDLAGTYSGRHNWHLEQVGVPALIHECRATLDPDLRDAGITLDVRIDPGLPPVHADRRAVRRAVQNLLQNAIKYGGEARWIGIRAVPDQVDGKSGVRITVEDRGLGIPPSETPHVFEPFFRGKEAMSHQIRGSGLGLSLVQRIVEAHGGRVGVEAAPGRGSSFSIFLAANEPPEAPASARATVQPSDAPPHTAR